MWEKEIEILIECLNERHKHSSNTSPRLLRGFCAAKPFCVLCFSSVARHTFCTSWIFLFDWLLCEGALLWINWWFMLTTAVSLMLGDPGWYIVSALLQDLLHNKTIYTFKHILIQLYVAISWCCSLVKLHFSSFRLQLSTILFPRCTSINFSCSVIGLSENALQHS